MTTTENPNVFDLPDPRARASARFNAIARSDAKIPDTTRLRCLAAVATLGVSVADEPSQVRGVPADGESTELLLRAALRDLASLPPAEFGSVREAAEHGRRALRALR